VCITAIAFEGNELSADFISHDVTLAAGQPGANDLVANFFLADIQEDQAGNQTAVVGAARLWGPDAPFRGTNAAGQNGYTTNDISTQVTALCVLVGDRNGRVASGTGNCAEPSCAHHSKDLICSGSRGSIASRPSFAPS
jgi:hypothetical protein